MAEVQADYYEEMFREITKKFYYGDDEDLLEQQLSRHQHEVMEEKTRTLLASDQFKMVVVKDDHDRDHDDDDEQVLLKQFNDEENSLLANVVELPNGFEAVAEVATDPLLPNVTNDEQNWICSEETIPWTTSKIASYNAAQKLFRCNECECIGFLSRIAEHWLGSHANLRVFQCSQCTYASAWARCVKMHLARQHHELCPETTTDEELQKLMKVNPVLDEVTKYLEELKSKLELTAQQKEEEEDTLPPPPPSLSPAPPPPHDNEAPPQPPIKFVQSTTAELVEMSSNHIATEIYAFAPVKRYNCEHCSYATDRKDLFTRHENIHRAEKPFQCNVCQKQFNRADHIKKHFIRMHRDHEYHLNNVRRPKSTTQTKCSNIGSGAGSILSRAIISSGVDKLQREKNSAFRSVSTLAGGGQKMQTDDTTLQTIIQRAIPTTVVIAAPATGHHHIIQAESHPTVIQSTQMQEFLQQSDGSGSGGGGGVEQVDIASFLGTHTLLIPASVTTTTTATKQETKEKPARVKKYNAEKNVQCSYCTWTGADNWCLKRHLNTHIKPYTCTMCGYKAARSERLTTHIFRVHNKRACTKCSFLADDIEQLFTHQRENHRTMKSRKKLKPGETISSDRSSIISTPVTSVVIHQ